MSFYGSFSLNAVRAEAKEGESPSMDLMSSLAAIRSAHGAKDDVLDHSVGRALNISLEGVSPHAMVACFGSAVGVMFVVKVIVPRCQRWRAQREAAAASAETGVQLAVQAGPGPTGVAV